MIRPWLLLCLALLLGLSSTPAHAEDAVFSGPQPGEKTTPFRVHDTTGPNAGKDVDYVEEFKGAPTVLVFVHSIERSLVPLLNVIDQYGMERKETLKTLFVFLTADKAALQQRLPLIRQSLRIHAPMTVSLDGPEGPGNYGLNKKCLMTVIAAKDNRVTSNFALVQPGVADAPKVIAALAKLIGDTNPPSVEELQRRRMQARERTGAAGDPMRPGVSDQASRLQAAGSSLEALQATVRSLQEEIRKLREELEQLKRQAPFGAKPSLKPDGAREPGRG